jgi:hypothetical protein
MFDLRILDASDRVAARRVTEAWRQRWSDEWITRFCPCSLTLSGACSRKRPSARRRRSRRSRTVRGKSADPGDGPSPDSTAFPRASS